MPAWQVDELPAPPPVNFRNIRRMVGPGAILLAASIGGGEWLVGPTAVVQYGTSILGIVTIAHRPAGDLQPGRHPLHALHGRTHLRRIPAPLAGASALGSRLRLSRFRATRLAGAGRSGCGDADSRLHRAALPTDADASTMHWVGSILLLLVVALLSLGGTIERMLELVSMTMLVMVILFLLVVNIFFIPWETWVRTFRGFFQLSGFSGDMDWASDGNPGPPRPLPAAWET